MTRLLTRESTPSKKEVIGVEYSDTLSEEAENMNKKKKKEWAPSVVLSSGGYAADRTGFLKREAPDVANLPTTNGPFALGDGIRLGR